MTRGGVRLFEVIVNGNVAAPKQVTADGAVHDLSFQVAVDRSSWIAIRQFPQLRTNPVHVVIDHQPIRASQANALWCAESIRLLWQNRRRFIREDEREAAREAYTRAIATYLQRADESPDDGLRLAAIELEPLEDKP